MTMEAVKSLPACPSTWSGAWGLDWGAEASSFVSLDSTAFQMVLACCSPAGVIRQLMESLSWLLSVIWNPLLETPTLRFHLVLCNEREKQWAM
jgi:hypothetical protein